MKDIKEVVVDRRRTTDLVFERLRDDIVSLKLPPGSKLSEAEIARSFGVSRQPVRDAFNRLENQDLLLIRPQRATMVRGFSLEQIAHSRFVRLAVELEVVRSACAVWDEARSDELNANLDAQQDAIAIRDDEKFHALDYDFHRLICDLSGHPLAFDTINDCKNKLDRLCMLSFGRDSETSTLLVDHQDLVSALSRRDAEAATDIVRTHLSRLDDTIADIHRKHSHFFNMR